MPACSSPHRRFCPRLLALRNLRFLLAADYAYQAAHRKPHEKQTGGYRSVQTRHMLVFLTTVLLDEVPVRSEEAGVASVIIVASRASLGVIIRIGIDIGIRVLCTAQRNPFDMSVRVAEVLSLAMIPEGWTARNKKGTGRAIPTVF